VLQELESVARGEKRLAPALAKIKTLAQDARRDQGAARTLVELLALAEAAALLVNHAPQAVNDAFLATRLQGSWRNTYGAGLAHADTRDIVARAAPQPA
jgi:putative acyl-CoA dehydrogenase